MLTNAVAMLSYLRSIEVMLDQGINSAALGDNDRFTKVDGYIFTRYADLNEFTSLF